MTFELNRMHLADALSATASLPSKSVDLVITDSAYDTMERHRAVGTTTRLTNSKSSSNEWFPVVDAEYMGNLIREFYRVLLPNTHLYLMCEYHSLRQYEPLVEEAGFTLRKPIIWHKVGKPRSVKCPVCGNTVQKVPKPGSMGMGYPYRGAYEMILFAEKGKRPPAEDKSVRDVIEMPEPEPLEGSLLQVRAIRNRDAYPTEKPVELLEILVSQSSNPSDLVLDPFAGSGSTLTAAANKGRQYLGFDVKQEALDTFALRAPCGHIETPKDPDGAVGIMDLFGG